MSITLARLRGSLALLVLPVASAVFAALLLQEQQPHWGGRMNDPSYTYLINGLNLATGHSPDHIDHPGTPVQVLTALALRAFHPGASGTELAEFVLTDPERHARFVSRVLIGCALVAMTAAAFWVFLRTGLLLPAVTVQAGAILVPQVLAGYSGLRPEPLLLGLVPGWVALWVMWVHGRLDLENRITLCVVAALAALAMACKYTFAPLVIIPLLLIKSWRTRAWFGVAVGSFFLLFIAPAWPSWRRLASWVFRVATHEGMYGGGGVGFGPRGGWGAALSEVFQANPAYCLIVGGALLFLPFAGRKTDGDVTRRRSRRLCLATAAALAAGLAIVAKQPGGSSRYLIPAAMATPLLVYGVFLAHRPRVLPSFFPLLAAAAFAGLIVRLGHLSSGHLAAVRAERLAAQETRTWIEQNLPGEAVIPYFGASSVPFAFASADYFSHRWSGTFSRLHPGFVYFDLWGRRFKRDFSGQPGPAPHGVFYLQGAPLDLAGVLANAAGRLPVKLTRVWSNPIECVYRVDPRE